MKAIKLALSLIIGFGFLFGLTTQKSEAFYYPTTHYPHNRDTKFIFSVGKDGRDPSVYVLGRSGIYGGYGHGGAHIGGCFSFACGGYGYGSTYGSISSPYVAYISHKRIEESFHKTSTSTTTTTHHPTYGHEYDNPGGGTYAHSGYGSNHGDYGLYGGRSRQFRYPYST